MKEQTLPIDYDYSGGRNIVLKEYQNFKVDYISFKTGLIAMVTMLQDLLSIITKQRKLFCTQIVYSKTNKEGWK